MRRLHILSALVFVLLIGGASSVGHGYPLSVSAPQWDFADATMPIPFYIDLPVPDLPVPAATGTLIIEARGDLDRDDYEYITYTLEMINLGIAYNGDPNDDRFAGATDHGTNYTVITRTATLTAAELSAVTADHVVTLTVQRMPNVNDESDNPDEYIKATIEYEALPEPATLAMLALGGLLMPRRLRRS